MNSYSKLLGAMSLCFFLCLSGNAQQLDNPWSLKISLGNVGLGNLNFQSTTEESYGSSLSNGITVDLIKKTQNGDSHSFGLANLGFGWRGRARDQFGTRSGAFSFQGGLRYEYTWNILKGPEPKKWEPYLGVGAFVGTSYEPGILPTTNAFPFQEFVASKTWRFYAGAELIPGIKWNISDRVFLDFALPIQYMPKVYNTTRFNEGNGFTGRTNSTWNNANSLRMGFRIGIGIRLGK